MALNRLADELYLHLGDNPAPGAELYFRLRCHDKLLRESKRDQKAVRCQRVLKRVVGKRKTPDALELAQKRLPFDP